MTDGPHFAGRVLVEQFHSDFWIVRAPLYYLGSRLMPGAIIIPAGLVTDFGSIPRVLWWWAFPTEYDLAPAFLLHDYCYVSHCVGRELADALLYEAARARGERNPKAAVLWAGVRLCGARAYERAPQRHHEQMQRLGLD